MSTIMTLPNTTDNIRIVRADEIDDYAIYRMRMLSLIDMIDGNTNQPIEPPPENYIQADYAKLEAMQIFLREHAEQFWIAQCDDKLVGYARTINIGGLRQLTDFFVLPEIQSSGVGKELLRRAFPAGSTYRSIIATTDIRAQALYMKAGLYPYTNIYSFVKAPTTCAYQTDLQIVPMTSSKLVLDQLATIDETIIGIRRDAIHQWLLTHKTGFLYLRNNQPVGYGYIDEMSGPFAVLDVDDYPALLAHAENYSASHHFETFNINVPTVNATAIHYALNNGYHMDDFTCVLMLEAPVGRFENYAVTVPMYFL